MAFMMSRYAISLVLVGCLMIQAGKAGAYCVGNDKLLPGYDPNYYSVSHEFRRSEYVVKARVLREIWIGYDGKEKILQPPFQQGTARPGGLDAYAGVYYDVKVLQAFKGNPESELRLFSANSTGRFWLKVGFDYILFISEDSFDPPIGIKLTTDNCGNSAGIKAAQATVHALEGLSKGN
jgi:hypothetical protein